MLDEAEKVFVSSQSLLAPIPAAGSVDSDSINASFQRKLTSAAKVTNRSEGRKFADETRMGDERLTLLCS